MKSSLTLSALMLAAAALGGCASNNPQPNANYYSAPAQSNASRYGTVESIQLTRADNNTSGAGAVVGGLVGGLLGNQVGAGNGRAAATVVGAVGGAVVGNNIERNRNAQTSDLYQIGIRLENGDRMTVVQESADDLRVGNPVRIVDGRAYRY